MAFNDLEFHAVKKEVEAFVESRQPPVHIRPELDIYYRIDNQTIEIGEVRPVWKGEPEERFEMPSARITYIRSQKAWKIYWCRANGKWEWYATFYTLSDSLDVVGQDYHGCFFG